MNLKDERDFRDWEENQRYPWRWSPLTMCVALAGVLVAVWVVGTLIG